MNRVAPEVQAQELARLQRLCDAQRTALRRLQESRDRIRGILVNDGRGWASANPIQLLAEIEAEVVV